MSQSGFGSGNSLADDWRPIINGRMDKRGWITGHQDNVNSMKERHPDDNHPTEEWLAYGFSMISLDQGRTVTAPLEKGGVAITGQVSGDVVSRPLSSMQRRLVGLTSNNANPEPRSQQAFLNQ